MSYWTRAQAAPAPRSRARRPRSDERPLRSRGGAAFGSSSSPSKATSSGAARPRPRSSRPSRHAHRDQPVLTLMTMTIPSYRAIENLIASYAELVDHGEFAAVGVLLADATFTGAAGSVTGRGAVEKMLRDNVIVYDDGTPRTKHVTTNIAIEVDEEARSEERRVGKECRSRWSPY